MPRAHHRPLRSLKNHFLYLLARLVLGFLRRLPTRSALAVGRGLGGLAYFLARPERRRAEHNLAAAGLMADDPRARAKLVRRMFAHFGESVAECAQLRRLRPQLPAIVTFEPGAREVLETAMAEGRGLIFITGHLGNWELMAALLARHVPATVLYKPSYDARFTRLLGTFRAESGVGGIDVTQPGHLARALAVIRRGGALGLLIDQRSPAGGEVSFMGRPALTSRLAAVLARRTEAPVVAGFVRRSGTCQHRVQIQRLSDPSAWRERRGALRTLTSPLEAAILRAPEQWAWSLDRWRGAPQRQKSSPYCK